MRRPSRIPRGPNWSCSQRQRRASVLPSPQGAAARTPWLALQNVGPPSVDGTLSAARLPMRSRAVGGPLRHCTLLSQPPLPQTSDLNPQGGPAQVLRFPGEPANGEHPPLERFSDGLISLRRTFLRHLRVAACVGPSFLYVAE